jgi:hypothetical protein
MNIHKFCLSMALGCGVTRVTAAATAAISFGSSENALTTTAGTPLTITVNRPVTWSLSSGGLGSLISASNTSVVYVPPASGITAQNSLGGCLALPNDSIFNTRIDTLPVHRLSAGWVGQTLGIGAVGVSFWNSLGVNVIDNTVAVTNATFYYTTALNGLPFQFAPPPVRKRESGAETIDEVNDHHLISVNRQTCRFYESYQDGLGADGTSAQSGYTYSANSYTQPSGGTTDAAGLPLAPLLLHVSEIEAGSVKHALRFTSCTGCIGNAFLWPATYSTGPITGNAAAPMGSRWRLKSSFEVSGFSAKAQVVLRALQRYGMILADIGFINQIDTSSDVNTDPEVVSALAEIGAARIIASDFDVIDESSLEVSVNSHQAKPGGLAPVASYAVLKARDADGNVLSVPIALEPVLVGTPYAHLIFQAGQSVQLKSWVNGSSNQNVTWTTSVGEVSSSGLYTPPSPVSSPTAVTLTGTAAADSSAKTVIYGWVIPSGAIRIDVGNPNSYTDSKGNLWMADTLGFESGSFSRQDDNYPTNAWGSLVDAPLYETYIYTWGDDIVYGPFVVPNGSYSIQFLFGHGNCTGAYNPAAASGNGLTSGPVVIEANGVDTLFNAPAAENDICRTAAIGAISASVTNNLLTVAVRSAGSRASQSSASLNALSIVPAR